LVVVAGLVEASKPKGADVSSQGPLTNPDGILKVLKPADDSLEFFTVTINHLAALVPGQVLVSINHNVFHVVVGKEVVPAGSVGPEGVMEHKFYIRVSFVDFDTSLAVEILERGHIRVFPGLVKWLNGIKSWVVTPTGHDFADHVDAPLNVVVVNFIVSSKLRVVVAHPVAGLDRPVLEVSLVDPLKIRLLA